MSSMETTRFVQQRVAERVKELGRLGRCLQGHLPPGLPNKFFELGLGHQARYVVGDACGKYSTLERFALSLLVSDVPLQVFCRGADALLLAEMAIDPLPEPRPGAINLAKRADSGPTYRQRSVKGRGSGSLVRFGDVYRDLCSQHPGLAGRYMELSGYTRDFFDDQACSVLLLAVSLQRITGDTVALAIRMVRDEPGCKSLNVAIKGLGLNSTLEGGMLCEGVALQGKGSGNINLAAKATERVSPPGSAGSIPDLNEDALRASIRHVLSTELRDKMVEFTDMDAFWDRRWQWAVNGGHGKLLERKRPELATGLPGRVHRRAALEQWERNPVIDWDGHVNVSTSVKYECGKQRMILACDTVSYVAFEHLLKPIERAWRNERVLLDPGRYGHYGVCRRVRDLKNGGGEVWLMLDYDDFNSQHTLRAQQLVIEEVCLLTGYDSGLAKRLVDSFEKMDIYSDSDLVGRATATLMSGHRATSFINSVLNASYVRYSIGRGWDNMRSLHTGDDVVCAVASFSVAGDILKKIEVTGLRINALKQSVGMVVSEFLRVASTDRGARGYAIRGIAAATSGSWLEGGKAGAQEAAQTLIQIGRTLTNRTGSHAAAELLQICMRRRSGIGGPIARRLLRGEATLGCGPSFREGARLEEVDVKWPEKEKTEDLRSQVEGFATHAYLERGAAPVEVAALELAGLTVVDQMLLASYGKTLGGLDDEGKPSDGRAVSSKRSVVCGSVGADRLLGLEEVPGVLSRYPLLNFLKRRLRRDQVMQLVRLAGSVPSKELMVQAWGPSVSSCCINGVLSYSDASHMCSLTSAGVIDVMYPVAV